MHAIAVMLAAAVVTLHSGERRWFMPGQVKTGAHIACVAHGGTIALTVPDPHTTRDIGMWNGPVRASLSMRDNGAFEVDCDVSAVAPRLPARPYIVGRNGLGLLRGANTLARVERLYGPGAKTLAGGSCRVAWFALGLRATFASCSAEAVLTGARIGGSEWSALDGVRIGDSPARLLWQDAHAKRLSPSRWLLGGTGQKQRPRLVALIGATGTVTSLVLETR